MRLPPVKSREDEILLEAREALRHAIPILSAVVAWRDARMAAVADPNPETFRRLGEAEYALMQLARHL